MNLSLLMPVRKLVNWFDYNCYPGVAESVMLFKQLFTKKIEFQVSHSSDFIMESATPLPSWHLHLFHIGKHAYIRNFNELFGNQYDSSKWTRRLVIEEGVLCISHHFVDVAGAVVIRNHLVIADRDTQFLEL